MFGLSNTCFLFLTGLFLFFQLEPAYSYPNSYLNGYEINELFTTDPTVFLMEANLWTAVGLVDSTKRTYTCWGFPVLAGYKILSAGGYLERTYTNLPPHDAIYWKFKIPIIDYWGSPDSISIQVGGKSFSTGDLNVFRSYVGTTYCGSSYYNDLFRAWEMGKIFHTGNSVTIRVTSLSTRPPTTSSFGIREVTMFLVNKTADDAEMGCFGSDIKNIQMQNNCTCPVGKYVNPLNSSECLGCDSSCQACFGPGANQCYGCKSAYSYLGGICSKCDSSCLACSGPGENQCTSCSTSLWYTWDNRCSDSCDAPYVQQTLGSTKMCMTPCTSSQYFLWNETCANNCTFPHLKGKSTEYGQICERPCNETEFVDWNGNCRSQCDYPLVEGNNSVYLTCDLPCPGSSNYFYPNQTCQSSCDAPFIESETEGGSLKFCDYPCSLADYIYPNGSCLSDCNSPFLSRTSDVIKVCDYPCQFGESLFYDGSCLGSCSSPHYERTQDNITYCDACPPDNFYYSNNSCSSSCPDLLTNSSINGSLFCANKCLATSKQVLKYDGTCIDSCDSPLVYYDSGDYRICSSPCENPNDFIYQNGSFCSSKCKSPYKSNILNDDVKQCLDPCPTDYYYYNETEKCSAQCPGSYRNFIWGSIKFCFSTTLDEVLEARAYAKAKAEVQPLITINNVAQDGTTTGLILSTIFGAYNPATATIGEFVKMLPYIRYMKIKYPAKLQLMLDNMNSSLISFSFGLKMPAKMRGEFVDYDLPENFHKYNLASDFLVNYWQTFTSLVIVMAIVGVLTFLEKITKKKKTLNFFMRRLNLICKWNYLLMLFCTNFDGVALYSSLQFRAVHFDSWAQVLSFMLCIVMNLLALGSLALVVYIILDIRKIRRRSVVPLKFANKINPTKKWERFQLFFVGSKESSFIQHIFMFPYLLRFYIFYSVVAYLFENPLCQTILITMLSLFILSYIVLKRPFTSKLVFLQHTSDEIVMLTVNICLLSLAICDEVGLDYQSNLRERLGDIVIYANLLLCITCNVYLVAYLFIGFQSAYQKSKKYKSLGVLAWLTAFLAPFESGGMDLDVLPDEEGGNPPGECPPNKTQTSISQAVRSYMEILSSPHSSSTSIHNEHVFSGDPIRRKSLFGHRGIGSGSDSEIFPSPQSSNSLNIPGAFASSLKNKRFRLSYKSTGIDSDMEGTISPQSSNLLTDQLQGDRPLWKNRTLQVLRKNLRKNRVGPQSSSSSSRVSPLSDFENNFQNSFSSGSEFALKKSGSPILEEGGNNLHPKQQQSPSDVDTSLSVIKYSN